MSAKLTIIMLPECQVKDRAVELAKAMKNEDGVTGAVKAFYKHFPGKKTESELEPVPTHSKLHSVRRYFGCLSG